MGAMRSVFDFCGNGRR